MPASTSVRRTPEARPSGACSHTTRTPRSFGVRLRGADGPRVAVTSEDDRGGLIEHIAVQLIVNRPPPVFIEPRRLHETERPQPTRGQAPRFRRRFNAYRPGAAKRVDEGRARPPTRNLEQSVRQVGPQRRLGRGESIPPSVQRRPADVEGHRAFVSHQANQNRPDARRARRRAAGDRPLDACLYPFGNSGRMVQPGLSGRGLDLDPVPRAQPRRPFERFDVPYHLLEPAGGEAPHSNAQRDGQPAAERNPIQAAVVGLKRHPAELPLRRVDPQPSELVDEPGLETGRASGKDLHPIVSATTRTRCRALRRWVGRDPARSSRASSCTAPAQTTTGSATSSGKLPLYLFDRRLLPAGQPDPKPALDRPDVLGPVPENRRAQLNRVRTDQEQLQRIIGRVNPAVAA